MSGTRHKHGRDENTDFCWKNMNGRDKFDDLGVDGKAILR